MRGCFLTEAPFFMCCSKRKPTPPSGCICTALWMNLDRPPDKSRPPSKFHCTAVWISLLLHLPSYDVFLDSDWSGVFKNVKK